MLSCASAGCELTQDTRHLAFWTDVAAEPVVMKVGVGHPTPWPVSVPVDVFLKLGEASPPHISTDRQDYSRVAGASLCL